jgi:uncharacterized membrane protein YcaP (DUF421 family)
VDQEDVLAAAREEGVVDLKDMRYAIVERNGAVSIIRNS